MTRPDVSKGRSAVSQRLASLDALRGFDMMFIMGGDTIGHAMEHLKAAESGPLHILAAQLNHVAWEGFRFYDLIFPLFVFIAGVSLVYALSKAVERDGREGAAKRVVKRAMILFVLGVFYYGGWGNELEGRQGIEGVRLLGVLQRIALCYLFAGLLYLYLKPRGIVVTLAAVLGGYWALLSFVPMPGMEQVSFEEGKNVVNWFDSKFLPLFKWDGSHDPEGLLSTIPAIGSCLIGVLVGIFMRDDKSAPQEKVKRLVITGGVLVLLGHAWG